MVDVLNHFGLDYATFGNHEFDLKQEDFYQRMQEAKFTWISSNVLDNNGEPFAGVHQRLVVPITDFKTGRTIKLGIFGLTIDSKKTDYVRFANPMDSARQQIAELKKESDIIVALTHLSIDTDEKLVNTFDEIDVLLGGHEHVNYQRWRGQFKPILKGDANVRSVYVVDLTYYPETGRVKVTPNLVPINETLAEDPGVKKIVDQWMDRAFDAFREQGLDPLQVISITQQPLDVLESQVRTQSTNLTQLIADSLLHAYPTAELSLYNSGAIRVDDILPAGKITQYDVIRVLPFGDTVQLVEISGQLLQAILNYGEERKGTGTFLQCARCEKSTSGDWLINGKPLDKSRSYQTSVISFLANRYRNEPGFKLIDEGKTNDIRKLVIETLRASSQAN